MLNPIVKCEPKLVTDPALEIHERLGMLSDLCGKLTERRAKGCPYAELDLQCLNEELASLHADFAVDLETEFERLLAMAENDNGEG